MIGAKRSTETADSYTSLGVQWRNVMKITGFYVDKENTDWFLCITIETKTSRNILKFHILGTAIVVLAVWCLILFMKQ